MKKIDKKLYADDIQELLGIEYLPALKIAASELAECDVKKDLEYKANPPLNDKLEAQYGPLLDKQYAIPMYVKWVNKTVEYGVFADVDLERGDMVCEYTGVLCRDDTDDDENAYIWDYPTIRYEHVEGKKRRKKVKYCIDALKSGNFARFINHTVRKHQNVGVQIVPRNNVWHVVYVAKKKIKKGQQLLTYYGTQYWRDRQIVPHPIEP